MASPETELCRYVVNIEYDDIPDHVRKPVRRAFADTVGVTIAGIYEDAAWKASRPELNTFMDTEPEILLGVNGEAPPSARAFRVGTAAHALDYDDLSWGMDGHPSVTLVPPLLSLASVANATGQDLVTAYIAGFEVACAIAEPISPEHYEAGWHATSTLGTFGAAMAAANLLALDVERTQHALNIAASMPSGLKRNFGSMTKPLHAGICSRSGVSAARLAADEFTAESEMVSGDGGFWDLYGPDERSAFSFASDEWAVEEHGIHVKFYPCCYFTHTAIAATQSLVEENDIAPDDVERIDVRAAQGAADALHHENPRTELEAKFSMEYAVASAAVRERVGLSTFDAENIDDPDVQRVRQRVSFDVDESLEYDDHAAVVELHTDSDTYTRHQPNPPGTADNPLSEEQLRGKFYECVTRVYSDETADHLYDVFRSLGDRELAALVAPERPR